ncbi:hypothetical protein DCCM_4723 [Desulfocucumis palustris]|uniref:Uncharacterized protein n=1 Tax=Desulfocucumis palustris TaxID=1898651 RepID=A0A2L2XHY4_9FIRM|nr:hypothetical protein DCCM_4723 [Desulfocucumis palustris]
MKYYGILEGYKVLIYTGDGDMVQLVNDNITVLLKKFQAFL